MITSSGKNIRSRVNTPVFNLTEFFKLLYSVEISLLDLLSEVSKKEKD